MRQPAISVVIPCFNAERYVCAAVRSVLAQQQPELEIIVVDDGSTDGSAALLRRTFPQVTVIEQANQGVGAARNAGIAAARGQRVAFLDADDIWLPGKLHAQQQLLHHHPEARMTYAAWEVWSSADAEPSTAFLDDLAARAGDAAAWSGASGWIYPQLLVDCVVWTSTVLADRALLNEAGGFDPALRVGEDYDLWLRLSRLTPILRLNVPSALYRSHPASITRSAPTRNHKAAVIQRAIQRWGYSAPDGSLADAAAVASGLARSWSDYAGAHLLAGDVAEARQAAWSAVHTDPRSWLGWSVLAKATWRSLGRHGAVRA